MVKISLNQIIKDLNIYQLQSDLKTIYTNIEYEFKLACESLKNNAT